MLWTGVEALLKIWNRACNIRFWSTEELLTLGYEVDSPEDGWPALSHRPVQDGVVAIQ